MINSYDSIKAQFLKKSISVENLKKALEKLEDDDILYPNQVGNLTVVRNGNYIGYIDISEETYEQV